MNEPIKRKRYPSDLTDAQWEMIEPFIPPVSAEATVPTIERREIVNAILYVLRTGCSWRQMPHDLPECGRQRTILSASGANKARGSRS
jgi:putative transposase